MRLGASLAIASLVLAGACRDAPGEAPVERPPVEVITEVGEGEGTLNLLAFAGYVEDGTTDPTFDWVHPFERRTGCDVHVRYVDSGDEVVRQLGREGEQAYDGATVPGDVAGSLIAAREVMAVEPSLFRSWPQVLEPLRGDNARHYVVGGQTFGTPALYGPTLLLYDTRTVSPAPKGWRVLFEPDEYAGRIAMLDSPMAIADAALYLSRRSPELGITDPYALSGEQLDAAAALLEEQAVDVGLYWRTFTQEVDAFLDGDVVLGQGWPIALSLLALDRPVEAAELDQPTTGWADTWMVAAGAPHPNCMLRWMRWTLRPEVQAEMSLWYGAAPSNGEACRMIRKELGDFGDLVETPRFARCGDEAYLASLAVWRVPTVECGDGRGRMCTGLEAWRLRWDSLRG